MDGKTVKIFSIIASVIVVAAAVAFIIKINVEKTDRIDVPTPEQILYDLKFDSAIKYDRTAVEAYYLSASRYGDYAMKDEYCMIYQIRDEETAGTVLKIIGSEEKLPQVDYSEHYILLSIGRKIEKIGNIKRLEGKTSPIAALVFSDEYYSSDAFVYTMKPINVLSGEELEEYYWTNSMSECNFVRVDEDARRVASEGTYHKVYLRKDGRYEIELMSEKNTKKRYITEQNVAVTEISPTLIKIDYGDRNIYFNGKKDVLSIEYDVKTSYLIYNIITYMRVKDGEIQLILRDAYDSTVYAKIVRLPFTYDTSDLDSLVTSIEVIDNTHISVEYYKGENRELTKETVEVYGLYR